MDHSIEKAVAMIVMGAIAIVGMIITKSSDLASMAIGAIAGLAGTGIAGAGVSGVISALRTKKDES